MPRVNQEEDGRVTEEMEKCMQRLKGRAFADTDRKTISSSSRKCIEKLDDISRKLVSEKQKRTAGDLLSEQGLAEIFAGYVNIANTDTRFLQCNRDCFLALQRVMWDFTDASDKLRVECGKQGVVSQITLHLSNTCGQYALAHEEDQVPKSLSASLGVLQNCAKERENLSYFDQARTAGTIAFYAKQDADSPEKMIAVLTLCYIMNDNDKGCMGRSMVPLIMKYLELALEAQDHRYHGFSVEELVDGLSHLAGNDENKMLILNPKWGFLETLANLMEKGCEREKHVSVEAVWTLSFSEDNNIRCEAKIVEILEKLKNGSGLSSRSAAGALFILQSDFLIQSSVQCDACPIPEDAESYDKINARTVDFRGGTMSHPKSERIEIRGEKHIMISYNWSSKATAKKIYERLCQLNYRVWIDEEGMEESLLDSMAKAIENAAVVVMCMCRKYKDSNSCQLEAKYAQRRRVPLMPVRVEQGYDPDGWLGILQSDLCYADLSNEGKFDTEFQNLVKRIGQRGKCSGWKITTLAETIETAETETFRQCSHGDTHMKEVEIVRHCEKTTSLTPDDKQSPDARRSKGLIKSDTVVMPLEHWSVQDVRDWAVASNLEAETFRDLDGKCVAFLRKMKQEAPGFFYQYVTSPECFSQIQYLMNLCVAIDKLDMDENN